MVLNPNFTSYNSLKLLIEMNNNYDLLFLLTACSSQSFVKNMFLDNQYDKKNFVWPTMSSTKLKNSEFFSSDSKKKSIHFFYNKKLWVILDFEKILSNIYIYAVSLKRIFNPMRYTGNNQNCSSIPADINNQDFLFDLI